MCIRDSYWTTRRYANSRIANSRTGRLVDWTSRGLDNSHTGQVADTTGDCMISFRSFGGICKNASCPVRELSSPRDVQSASWQSASWRIRELSSYHNKYVNHNINKNPDRQQTTVTNTQQITADDPNYLTKLTTMAI